MDRTMKVFLSCALGAFVGTLVALEVNSYFWWFGMLAGGLVGYLSYEFKQVLVAARTAWHKTMAWRPDQEYWQAFFHALPATNSFIGTLMVGITGVVLGFVTAISPTTWSTTSLFTTMAGVAVVWALLASIAALETAHGRNEENWEQDLSEMRRLFNPFRFYFRLVPKALLKAGWWLLKTAWWLLRRAPVIGGTTARFFWQLFRLIHSDERLLCGLDAAIGAGIGYLAGNAALGALAGGLMGVVNYELISKRLLHLVPAKNG